MFLRPFSVLVALCLDAGCVGFSLPVGSLPINAIEIAQSRSNLTSAENFVIRGGEKGKKEDFQGAIADFNEAIRINPNYAKAYYNRGVTYGQLGETQKAITDYNQAIRLNPNYAVAYLNRGVTYGNLGEYQKAIADFNQSLRINPNYAEAYANRGITYGRLEKTQKAIADFQKAANLFQQQGNTAEAQKILEVIKKLQKLRVAAQRGTLWDSPQLMEIVATSALARLEAQTLTVQTVLP